MMYAKLLVIIVCEAIGFIYIIMGVKRWAKDRIPFELRMFGGKNKRLEQTPGAQLIAEGIICVLTGLLLFFFWRWEVFGR